MASTLGSIKLTESKPEEVMKQYDVVEDAKRSVLERGFKIPQKPSNGFNGQIPLSLTGLGDDELGDLLAQLSNWIEWAEIELMEVKSEVTVFEKKVEFLHSHIRIETKASGEKLTVQDKQDITNCDQRVIDAEARLLFLTAQYEMMRSMVNGAKTDWDTISRRITQRGQDLERMKRVENVANIKNPFRR